MTRSLALKRRLSVRHNENVLAFCGLSANSYLIMSIFIKQNLHFQFVTDGGCSNISSLDFKQYSYINSGSHGHV